MKRPTLAPAVTAPRLPRVRQNTRRSYLTEEESSWARTLGRRGAVTAGANVGLLVFCRQPNFRKYGSATHLKAGLRIVEVVEDVPRQPQLSGVSLQVPADEDNTVRLMRRYHRDSQLMIPESLQIVGAGPDHHPKQSGDPCDTGALDVQCCLRQDCRSYRDL
jgi:hypothetical protein